MSVSLPPLPSRIAALPKDERGYPVPWFVCWMNAAGEPTLPDSDSKPDFRVLRPRAIEDALRRNACWICGDIMGRHRVFAIGPMCVVNRVTMEPPSHRECAEFAVRACPFMIRPRQKRDLKDLPEDAQEVGLMIKRNPGVTALYETPGWTRFKVDGGYLIRLNAPTRIDWWAEGREATRKEVDASVAAGIPVLADQAVKGGVAEMAQLMKRAMEAEKWFPAP